MSDDDGIEMKMRFWPVVQPSPPSITIGDIKLVFPPGTTDEEAQSVLDEAKRIYREQMGKA